MAEKLPLKGVFSGSTVTGLAEFRSADNDVVGVTYGCLLYTSPSPRDRG